MAVELDEFEEFGKRANTGCWFQKISSEQQRKVMAAHEAGYSQRAISKVLTEKWEKPTSRSRVGAHFAGECHCG